MKPTCDLVMMSLRGFLIRESIIASMHFINIEAIAMNLTCEGFGISSGFLFSIINLVHCAVEGIVLFFKQSLIILRKFSPKVRNSSLLGSYSICSIFFTIKSVVQSTLVALSSFISFIAYKNSSISTGFISPIANGAMLLFSNSYFTYVAMYSSISLSLVRILGSASVPMFRD